MPHFSRDDQNIYPLYLENWRPRTGQAVHPVRSFYEFPGSNFRLVEVNPCKSRDSISTVGDLFRWPFIAQGPYMLWAQCLLVQPDSSVKEVIRETGQFLWRAVVLASMPLSELDNNKLKFLLLSLDCFGKFPNNDRGSDKWMSGTISDVMLCQGGTCYHQQWRTHTAVRFVLAARMDTPFPI